MERWVLEMALDGIDHRSQALMQDRGHLLNMLELLDEQAREKKSVVKPAPAAVVPKAPKKKKRNLSEAARARIAQAQVTRWQKHRAAKGQ